MKPFIPPLLVVLAGLCGASLSAAAGRVTQSLDGTWQIADGTLPAEMPMAFTRTVPVPGLVNLAKPAFPDVDRFISRENLANRIRSKLSPAEWLTNYGQGKVDQDRIYFWYRRQRALYVATHEQHYRSSSSHAPQPIH